MVSVQLDLFPPQLSKARVRTIARRLVIIGMQPDQAWMRSVDVLRDTYIQGVSTREWHKAAVQLARKRMRP